VRCVIVEILSVGQAAHFGKSVAFVETIGAQPYWTGANRPPSVGCSVVGAQHQPVHDEGRPAKGAHLLSFPGPVAGALAIV
jgi:hypothetical protein